jgi:hypothetical protein
VFVPFTADFTNSKDMTLESDLRREAPGILWKLIEAAPRVFERGVEPPASVLDATADVLDENDVARPFIEECLMDDPSAVTPLRDMETAVEKWAGGEFGQVDRIMAGIRTRWEHGRRRVTGQKHPVRGLLGVRVRDAEGC